MLYYPCFYCLVICIIKDKTYGQAHLYTLFRYIHIFEITASLLFLNGYFMLFIYSGVPLYLPTKENYNQRLQGSKQMTINQLKTSGTETQHWAINTPSPVTAYSASASAGFHQDCPESSYLPVAPQMGGSFSKKPRQHILFLSLRTWLSQALSPVFREVKCVQLPLTHPLQDF